MKRLEKWIFNLFAARTAAHVCFCLVFIIVFTIPAFFRGRNFNFDTNGIVLCGFLLATTYSGRWACKKWILKKKILRFLPVFLLLVLLLATIGAKGASVLFSGNKVSFWNFLAASIPLVLLFMFLGIFVTITRVTLLRQMTDALIAQQQKQSELELLISQLSPHFLFNTLNNLYGLSLTRHEVIPGLLLKLSDLLRYSVYDTRKAFVPLRDEIGYISNYIELEKIRMGANLILSHRFDVPCDSQMFIAPMLLIVFLENAFKHGKNTLNGTVTIDIDLHISRERIHYTVRNSFQQHDHYPSIPHRQSGVGLANTVKRLELLYPSEYRLHNYVENNYYIVELQLPVR
ncbi:MAG TPA: histidine kinase [Puia sp.]|uniref:sensor histidine kinase n=1 Tax=Puia sp. TaxID=2045100 RepID=UPI002BD9AFBF|nr:histidine kinase [Puia sp.]HVU95554.1 histidine kinase [Puia sp.]